MSTTKKKKKKKKRQKFFNTLCQSKLHPSCSSCCLMLSMFLEKKRKNSLASQTFANKCRQILQKEPHLICSPKITKRHYNIEDRYFILRLARVPEWAWYSVNNHLALRFIFGNRAVLFLQVAWIYVKVTMSEFFL